MSLYTAHDADHGPASQDRYAQARLGMVENIRSMAAANHWGARPMAENVLLALSKVPRHCFVPPDLRAHAYGNHPLPIGNGQTISQPYIVALMTDWLALDKQHRVLEIGTGSGYQAAVLSELAGQVYSLEVLPQLAASVAKLLADLGYRNVHVKAGDGCAGWSAHAPYDRIIVTAAARHIPQPLLDQLKPGGRLVIPVGGLIDVQQLQLITKDAVGQFHREDIESVRFVPFIGAD